MIILFSLLCYKSSYYVSILLWCLWGLHLVETISLMIMSCVLEQTVTLLFSVVQQKLKYCDFFTHRSKYSISTDQFRIMVEIY